MTFQIFNKSYLIKGEKVIKEAYQVNVPIGDQILKRTIKAKEIKPKERKYKFVSSGKIVYLTLSQIVKICENGGVYENYKW
jgi:hypothetical protein